MRRYIGSMLLALAVFGIGLDTTFGIRISFSNTFSTYLASASASAMHLGPAAQRTKLSTPTMILRILLASGHLWRVGSFWILRTGGVHIKLFTVMGLPLPIAQQWGGFGWFSVSRFIVKTFSYRSTPLLLLMSTWSDFCTDAAQPPDQFVDTNRVFEPNRLYFYLNLPIIEALVPIGSLILKRR